MSVPSASRRAAITYGLLWIVLPPLSLGYQIAAKTTGITLTGVSFEPRWIMSTLSTPSVQVLLACEVASFAAWMTVLSNLKLSQAFPATALSYVLVLLASWSIFRETIEPLQIAGSIVIMAGVWLLSFERATP